jgi:SAM-dependent methyltransferase
MAFDDKKRKAFLERLIGDIGAAISGALVVVGDQLGLYKAMAGAGPLTPAQLAQRTGTAERLVREWLANQAAGGYVAYDPATGTFTLPDEHAVCLADENSPTCVIGSFQAAAANYLAIYKVLDAFRTGKGVDWRDQDPWLFLGTERCFRPNYLGNLVSKWIPALDGVEEKLCRGACVADVGCGHGLATILLAQAYPKSRFIGFDYHAASIEEARRRAEAAGVADRVRFEVARSTEYPGDAYDFITFFDCLHDMGDPVGAARRAREALAADGTLMIVEPFAHDHLEDNLNPIGRMMYGASSMVCVPASLAQDGPALGAQAGEARLRDVVVRAGFTRFRRAAETRFNLVFEARP